MVSELPPLTEIGDSTWRLRSELGGRNVFQYLLATPERDQALLIDTGTTETPREVILPALRKLGIATRDLRFAVVTHSDLDHQGGLAALASACEAVVSACGFHDLAMISDPEKLLSDRYQPYLREHGLGYGPEEIAWMRANYGAPAEIDLTLSGGERLRLGDRELVAIQAPGHSPGHLVLHEPAAARLFSSDAVHWRACPGIDGGPALCPTYEEVDAYLNSIELLEGLAPEEVHSGHWPECRGAEVTDFLSESREFVEQLDAALITRLREPATLLELCQEVDATNGPWESEPKMLMFCVHGHLRRLVRRGVVEEEDLSAIPRRFRLSAEGISLLTDKHVERYSRNKETAGRLAG